MNASKLCGVPWFGVLRSWIAGTVAVAQVMAADLVIDNQIISTSQFHPVDDPVDRVQVGGTSLIVTPEGSLTVKAQQLIQLLPGTWLQAGSTALLQIPASAFPQSVTTLEDSSISIVLLGAGTSGTSLTYSVVAPPTKGFLVGGGPSWVYTPSSNANGSDSFQFTVSDGFTTSVPATVTISIAPVNDAPSFVKGADQNVLDSVVSPVSISGWASGFLPGPASAADELGQTLTFAASGFDATMFSSPPSVSSNGTSIFTPSGKVGATTVWVTLSDDGGTANGGANSGTPQSFTITISDSTWSTLPAQVTLIASETVYPTAVPESQAGSVSDARVTTYAYTWHPGSVQIASKATTLPIVSAANNGPGAATTTVEVYDRMGRTIWSRDGEGYITYRAYDPYSGGVVRTIEDVDSGKATDFTESAPWATPATPSVAVAGGLHLKTDTEVDERGRPLKITDPSGRITYTTYQDAVRDVANNPLPVEVRIYSGWSSSGSTGPTVVSRDFWNHGFRENLTMAAAPAVGAGGGPTGTEAISQVQSLSRETLDTNGRVTQIDVYYNLGGLAYAPAPGLGALNTHFDRSTAVYDTRGHLIKAIDATGTIRRTVVDFLGRPIQRWLGTSDSSWTGNDVPGQFLKTTAIAYDGNGVGIGLVTQSTVVHDSGVLDTYHSYDELGRLIRSLGPDQVLTTRTLDNLDRVTSEQSFAGVTVANLNGTPSSSALRARTDTAYDEIGNICRREEFSVTPANGASPGAVGSLRRTDRWYDRRGLLFRSATGTGGAVTASRIDGAGRTIETWTGAGASAAGWASGRTSDGDIVATASRSFYDATGHLICTTGFVRPDGAPATPGGLTAANSLLSVSVAWFDAGGRLSGTADYGRDNGSARYVWDVSGNLIAGASGLPSVALAPPPAVNSSGDYRVTRLQYDSAGLPYRTTDNLGHITQIAFDAAGREISTIANYVTGTASGGASDTDQTTTFERSAGGRITKRHVLVGNGSALVDQVTHYLYGSTINKAWVTSTIFPDSSDTTSSGVNQVKVAYDRLGRPTQQTDQRGVVRQFTYVTGAAPGAGQLLADAANTVPSGVDAAVRRIEYGYDDAGRPRSVTSYDASSGGSILDQLVTSYDAWGNVLASQQEHAGAVKTSTPQVTATWDWGGASSGPVRSVRMSALDYPTSGTGIGYRYATDTLGKALDQVVAITSGGSDIVQYDRFGAGGIARQRLPLAGQALLDRSTPVGSGNGYDRFWAVAKHTWTSGGMAVDGFQQAHDRMGRVVARVASWGTGRSDCDDAATYDGLNRLITFRRGVADGVGAIPSPADSWSWTLDAAGNWLDSSHGSATQTRVHNSVNEIDNDNVDSNAPGSPITVTGGPSWTQPTYDASGGMKAIPAPGAEGTSRTLAWDAWGRLVQVSGSGMSTWTARYDGRHRLIQWRVDGVTWDSYTTDGGQEVEVRKGGFVNESLVWGLNGVDNLVRFRRDSLGTGNLSQSLGVLTDNQGSVTALVDESTGQVVERYRYDAYGGLTIAAADSVTLRSVSSFALRYGFTGRPFDATTGLGYYRTRWYHPTFGRFISNDPAGYIDGGNVYQYVIGNPLQYTDPSGLSPKTYTFLQNLAYVLVPMHSQRYYDEQKTELAATRAYLTAHPEERPEWEAQNKRAIWGAVTLPVQLALPGGVYRHAGAEGVIMLEMQLLESLQDGERRVPIVHGSVEANPTLEYELVPKHAKGGWDTLMDLDNKCAQKALSESILSGKQRYAVVNETLYAFKNGENGKWHGYPIRGNEAPIEVLRELKLKKIISSPLFDRMRRGLR